MLISLIDFLRIRQWVKNLVILAPLIFSGKYHETDLWLSCILSFLGFCLISSAVYIFNDIIDVPKDQFHPHKKNRALVAGKVSLSHARWIAMLLLFLGASICLSQGMYILLLAIAYIGLFVVYNFLTKNIVFLDVLTVVLGFQIRIWAGAVVIHVQPSYWLQICMFVLALFLAFTKRRCEKILLADQAASHRAVLEAYSMNLLNQMINISAILSILLYGLYTNSHEVLGRTHHPLMLYSIIFVVYGIYRYLYLLDIKKIVNDPTEIIISDWPILINIILWITYIICVL